MRGAPLFAIHTLFASPLFLSAIGFDPVDPLGTHRFFPKALDGPSSAGDASEVFALILLWAAFRPIGEPDSDTRRSRRLRHSRYARSWPKSWLFGRAIREANFRLGLAASTSPSSRPAPLPAAPAVRAAAAVSAPPTAFLEEIGWLASSSSVMTTVEDNGATGFGLSLVRLGGRAFAVAAGAARGPPHLACRHATSGGAAAAAAPSVRPHPVVGGGHLAPPLFFCHLACPQGMFCASQEPSSSC